MATPNLCLSGGTALNCPSNSEIARSGLFESVYVEPACDDGGIAIGAALAAYHNILGRPRVRQQSMPYLGKPYTQAQVAEALSSVDREVEFETCEDPAKSAATDLMCNRIVGWFERGSEVGPRALGHRSILADARQPENWSSSQSSKGSRTLATLRTFGSIGSRGSLVRGSTAPCSLHAFQCQGPRSISSSGHPR